MMQVANFWYPGASFGSRTHAIFGYQTRKLSATNQQWSLWLYTKHLMDMSPRFWIRLSSNFRKYSICKPWEGFSANNFTSRNAILFIFFKTWKTIDSLTCVPNFLFSDIYLNLLFNFKVGPSLDHSDKKRKDSLETRTAFNWILILNWNFVGG